MTRPAIALAAASLLLTLAGCGGSSEPFGLQESPNTGQIPGTGLAITASNAASAAGLSYAAGVGSLSTIGVASSVGDLVGGGAPAKPGLGSLERGRLPALVVLAPFGPVVQGCAVSGTVSVSGDLASPTALTSGDSVTLVFDNCNDGTGETVDGRIDTTIDQFTPDVVTPANFVLGISVVLLDLQLRTAAETTTGNGDAGVIVDTSNPTAIRSSVAGNALTIDSGSKSETLSNYSSDESITLSSESFDFTLGFRGTLTSTALNAPVVFSTPLAFEGLVGERPSSGEMLITGNNSSVRLVVLDRLNVRLDVDSNGDGEIDVAIQTSWDAVLNPPG
ncbi:MAG: hypothetical protein AAFX56_11525 [Pseudomonadota bacterium]